MSEAVARICEHAEIIGSATLILGDCRKVIPALDDIGAVVTDPPYGIDPEGAGYGRSGRAIEGDKDLTVCHEALRLAAGSLGLGWMLAFYSGRVTPQFHAPEIGADYFGEIMWDKRAPGMGAGLRYQHEDIAVYRVGEPPDLKPIFSVQSFYRVGQQHPHEKPVELMKRLIEAAAVMPGRVLDPFMGSGSTGVAAVQLGIGFVGIERDPAYFEVACKRLRQASGASPGALFEQELAA